MAKKKTPPKKAKIEKNKKVASARQAKPVPKKSLVAKAKPAPAKVVAVKDAKKAPPAKAPPAKAQKLNGKAPVAAKGAKAPVVAAKAPVTVAKAPAVAKSPAAKVAEKLAAAALKAGVPTKKGKDGKKGSKEAELPPELAAAEAEIILTNADGKRYCKVGECDELATSDSYCRYHYLLNWKKIQLRKKILAGDKLNRYIEELTARYPDKYLEMIRKDLATDKDFLAALQELEIDEGADEAEFEDDSKTYVDEIRGVTSGGGGGGETDEDY